jgi:hypothetical protein
VLRDPPGGSSFSSISAGTEINFGLSIENAYTIHEENDLGFKSEIGFDFEVNAQIAPLGLGISEDMTKAINTKNDDATNSAFITNSRASSSTYDYSISFRYSFSTSTDPNIAGPPSDVIIGGGVALVVVQSKGG